MLRFVGALTPAKGCIELIDNGHGMSPDTTTPAFLEPATPFKRAQRRSQRLRQRVLQAASTSSPRRSGTRALCVLAALTLAGLAACGGGEDAPPAPTEPLSAEQQELADHLSARTMELWDVYNTYEVEDLRQFYEASYWEDEKEELRRNMEPFRKRDTVFEAEETSPPREIEPGKWQLKHKARFNGSSVSMTFIYEQFDGEWLLTYAEAD